jgi:hypothetical protein
VKSPAITIDRLASAFDATPPGHLFHYTDLEGVKGIFTSRMLWLSKFTATNDISEIKLAIEHFQTFAARKAGALAGGEGAFLRKAAAQLEGFRRTNICLASFCEQHDLLSQWRSYGNDGRGVALGFNSARLLEVAERNGLRLLRCVYEPAEHERISANLTDMLLEARRASPAGDGGELIAQFNDVFLRVAPVIKDHRFGEEREWRSSPRRSRSTIRDHRGAEGQPGVGEAHGQAHRRQRGDVEHDPAHHHRPDPRPAQRLGRDRRAVPAQRIPHPRHRDLGDSLPSDRRVAASRRGRRRSRRSAPGPRA